MHIGSCTGDSQYSVGDADGPTVGTDVGDGLGPAVGDGPGATVGSNDGANVLLAGVRFALSVGRGVAPSDGDVDGGLDKGSAAGTPAAAVDLGRRAGRFFPPRSGGGGGLGGLDGGVDTTTFAAEAPADVAVDFGRKTWYRPCSEVGDGATAGGANGKSFSMSSRIEVVVSSLGTFDGASEGDGVGSDVGLPVGEGIGSSDVVALSEIGADVVIAASSGKGTGTVR
mmetsp:Transcript_815/g.1931  ORF Transcript_815/g.1931 Transcript_815/m.1931 type:complete len:226 (+) Transcript_815:3811-4488(+)